MPLIDLSHTIEAGMITYQGLPGPVMCDFLSREQSRSRYSEGTEFQIGRIDMVGNTGTYVDSPFHRYADGKDLADLPLESLANLDCVVLRVPCQESLAIEREHVERLPLEGKALLIQTGWDRHWLTLDYYHDHPYVTEEAAEFLVRSAVKLVGIDSHNIDDTRERSRPAHSALLGAEIPICEHLCNLSSLPDESRFFAVPVKVRHFGTFPVRAFAISPGS